MASTIALSMLPIFFYALFRFSIGLVLPEVAGEFALDPSQEGLLLSVSLVATTATSGLAGYLSDRIGEKQVMTVGMVLFSSGLLVAMLSSRFDLFVILFIISGSGSGLMLTPTYSVIGRVIPRSRGLGTGVLGGIYNLGGFVGPALTSALLAAFSWRIPFVLMAGIGFVISILLHFGLDIPSDGAAGKLDRSVSRARLLGDRNIRLLCAAMFLADLAFLAFISWVPTFMRQELSMSAEVTGFWLGLAIAVGAVGVVSTGYLFDRVGGKLACVIGGATSAGLTFLLFLQSTVSALMLAILILAGFSMSTFWNLLSALAQGSVDETRLGTATGIVQNAGYVGAVIGPSIVGSIVSGFERISIALILTVSVPYLFYALVMLFYREPKSPSSP